jgi:hypothetical protein
MILECVWKNNPRKRNPPSNGSQTTGNYPTLEMCLCITSGASSVSKMKTSKKVLTTKIMNQTNSTTRHNLSRKITSKTLEAVVEEAEEEVEGEAEANKEKGSSIASSTRKTMIIAPIIA